jgi:hypothetical protein
MHIRANIFVKFMISGFALALSLGAMELGIRAFVPVRNVGPSFSTYDPIYGKVLKPNSSVVRIAPEFTMRLTTNSHGFRGPELGSLENGSILFIGDSFTMGYGVTDGEEYPAIVRHHLDGLDAKVRLEVINCGMGNNGNGRPLKFLRRGASRLNPKLIVVQINETDFADNVIEGLFSIDESGNLREPPVQPPSTRRKLQRTLESIPALPYSHLFCLVRGLARPVRKDQEIPVMSVQSGGDSSRHTLENRLLVSLQSEIVSTARDAGWPVLVLLTGIDGSRLEMLQGFFADRGVPVISLPTRQERPDLYFEVDGHWNAEGHVFVARRVLDAIMKIELTDEWPEKSIASKVSM